MDKKKHYYLMNKLMNYTELDAFAARNKAGSNDAYFNILAEFTEVAPGILATLTAPEGEEEPSLFLRRVNSLQKLLLGIGSPSLLWLAEKIAAAASSENKVKCEDELCNLAARVRVLCAKLDDAKADPGSGKEASGASASPAPPPPTAATRPKAPVRPELFEKLNILIENFEFDDAIALLRSLLGFRYNQVVDSLLIAVYKDLAKFDYEGSAAQAKRLIEATRETSAETGKAAKKKILAVDDMPDVLNTVKAVLKDDYAVYGVTNHMAALKFLTNNSADLILLDIEMPDMNGFALLGIIRKIKAYENTPVVFLTGNVSVENIKKAHSAGANDFMKKPIDAQVLLPKIAKHLNIKTK